MRMIMDLLGRNDLFNIEGERGRYYINWNEFNESEVA